MGPSKHALDRIGSLTPTVVVLAALAFCVIVPGLPSGPAGIHFIRQTDSLAFVVRFREFASNLLEPGVLDLRNAPDNGAAAGEFPIIYWLLAAAERLLGPLPTALRWLNLALVGLAHVVLARTLTVVLRDTWAACAITLLALGSGILIYYSFNFLPDAGVYAIVLLGWCLAMRDIAAGRPEFRWSILFLFTIAGAIKAPVVMHLLAWGGVLAADRIRTHTLPGRSEVVAFVIGLALVTSWHLHARAYNAAHGSNYFMTWSEPIWTMAPSERAATWDLVSNYWWTKYLHPSSWHLLGVLMVVIAIRHRRMVFTEGLTLLLLLASSSAFLLLFFRKLADHDYYFLTVLPLIVWILTIGSRLLLSWVEARWASRSIAALLSVFAVASLLLARTELIRRNAIPASGYTRASPYLDEIRQATAPLHLPLDARVMVIGDSSANGALTSLARMGWAYPGYPAAPVPTLDHMRSSGATHVLALDVEIPQRSDLHQLLGTTNWTLWEFTR